MNDKLVTKAKRTISHIETVGELQQLRKYLFEREQILNQRARADRQKAKWQKIADLPVGARVVVNAAGDRQWPRGTELEFIGVARTRLHLSREGKTYTINAANVDWFDLRPAGEFKAEGLDHPVILSASV